ncbi:hypothetical protein [Streptomyces acidiscabies]|uniref:hypothetical protein n=1 Tax=Streptomyces acidiscabies TaxID=42234 RepID=UPI0013C44023|nr:hypothetical protein [Streptomyces acidiscabies]MBP5942600.1 hypothetical protein [Streptomyces sp. LBUM 1476]
METSVTEYPLLDQTRSLPEVEAKPLAQREFAARLLLADVRKRELPDRRTWTMTDPRPTREDWVLAVVDGDGSLWRGQAGGDHWVQEEPLDTQGAGEPFTWYELIAEFGPLTEPPADWKVQRTQVLEVLRGAVVELDDLLFHELGPHTVGLEIPDGHTTEDSSDTDILRTAAHWAQRLREQVQALDTVLARADMMDAEAIREGTQ